MPTYKLLSLYPCHICYYLIEQNKSTHPDWGSCQRGRRLLKSVDVYAQPKRAFYQNLYITLPQLTTDVSNDLVFSSLLFLGLLLYGPYNTYKGYSTPWLLNFCCIVTSPCEWLQDRFSQNLSLCLDLSVPIFLLDISMEISYFALKVDVSKKEGMIKLCLNQKCVF